MNACKWLSRKDEEGHFSVLILLVSIVVYFVFAAVHSNVPETWQAYCFWIPVTTGSLALLRVCLMMILDKDWHEKQQRSLDKVKDQVLEDAQRKRSLDKNKDK